MNEMRSYIRVLQSNKQEKLNIYFNNRNDEE